MMDMSIPYESTGRVQQKSRTRQALIAATRRLLAQGITPTVEQSAAEADVSRTSAYRYFPSQRDLLSASHPEIDRDSLLGDDPPGDAPARLAVAAREMVDEIILNNEHELRAMLRLSLEDDAPREQLLRQGRRIRWVADALEPIQGRLTRRPFDDLVHAIGATIGIEPLVWLTDMAGVDRQRASALMQWSARTLLQAALAGDLPPATKTRR
jgi:AcrR family transcriptional regulator